MRRLVGTTTARAKPRRRPQLLPKARASGGTGHCRSLSIVGAHKCNKPGQNAMNRNVINRCPSTRLLSPLALIVVTGIGLSVASAQTSSQSQIVRPATTSSTTATSGSGQYYFEFRSRQAWDYGHTFVVFGRVGEPPSKKNVAGLSPKGDDPQMWLMGHYVPVPSDTGWTDGDLEDRYITSRYRVLVSKEQYDRTVAYIRQLQAKSTTWSVELYNCNAFVADIANFMGLKAPSSTWI